MKNTLNKILYQFYRKIGKLLFDRSLDNLLKEANHILLINWHGKIGDAIISSFIFRELRNKTNIQISVITTKELEPIYQYYNFNNIYLIKQKHNLCDINNIANKINQVDIIIPLIGTLGFNDLFLISKLSPSYVFSTDKNLKLSNQQFLKEIDKKTVDEIYHKILEFIGISNINDNYIIPYLKKIDKQLDYDILFNPFGSRIDKSLSIDKSVSLLKNIIKNYSNLKIIVIYSQSTKSIAKKIVEKLNCNNINLAKNIYSIKDSIKLIDRSSIVISVDTSIVHISIGMNKKVIAIYYKVEDNFNVWLPKKSLITKVIYSLGQKSDIVKNMNNFSNQEVIKQIRILKDLNNDNK